MSLAQRLLNELRKGPMKTPELIARTAYDRTNPRSQVWCVLQKLERSGLVKRQLVKLPRQSRKKIAAWSLA